VVGTLTGFFVGLLICLNIESIRQFLSWMTNTELFSPELYFLSKLPAEVDFGETAAVVIMALTLSVPAPRCIRHGVPRASIPSKRSGTSEDQMEQGAEDVPVGLSPRDKAPVHARGRRR
jgi:hypothetical protein